MAYTPEEEARVDEMLRKLSPRSATHLGRKTCRWQRGARVTVHADPVEGFRRALATTGIVEAGGD